MVPLVFLAKVDGALIAWLIFIMLPFAGRALRELVQRGRGGGAARPPRPTGGGTQEEIDLEELERRGREAWRRLMDGRGAEAEAKTATPEPAARPAPKPVPRPAMRPTRSTTSSPRPTPPVAPVSPPAPAPAVAVPDAVGPGSGSAAFEGLGTWVPSSIGSASSASLGASQVASLSAFGLVPGMGAGLGWAHRGSWRDAVVLGEILASPVSLRGPGSGHGPIGLR